VGGLYRGKYERKTEPKIKIKSIKMIEAGLLPVCIKTAAVAAIMERQIIILVVDNINITL
jgi:hypothetical protein